MSPGNGHPFSWSAICNGYRPEEMATCPFPVIPEYLAQQKWPDAKLKDVEVTHIWTQDRNLSAQIAKASRIPHIVDKLEDLVGAVDAILLARDDAENHVAMSAPFLAAGMPIFIDKPLAFSRREAQLMLDAQQYEGQLFSCSALRYSPEAYLGEEDQRRVGPIRHIQAQISKSWKLYGVHLLDPIVAAVPDRGVLQSISADKKAGITTAHIKWQNLTADVTTYGDYPVPILIHYFGADSYCTTEIKDTFSAFKAALTVFYDSILLKKVPIPPEENLEIVRIIETVHHA